MTWKSYAAVSGATVLTGWLVSTPPSNAPATAGVAASQPERRPAVEVSDIEREAARLEEHIDREVEYSRPRRNLFRFGAAEERPTPADSIAAVPPAAAPASSAPETAPTISLAGIAEDTIGQTIERTAILSSPSGVLLLREGDVAGDGYRVGRIETEAVELVKDDGTTLRLTFRP